MRDYYDAYQRIAKDDITDEFEKNKWRRMIPFRNFINAKDGEKILEIGVARGLLLSQMEGYQVGIDIALPYLRTFKDGYERIQALAENLPFPQDCFDVVIADSILEHLLDLNSVLAELERVLKPNGRLYVLVPNDEDVSQYKWEKEKYGITEHLRSFHESSDFQGFNVVQCRGVVPNGEPFARARSILSKSEVLLLDKMRLLWRAPRFLMFELCPRGTVK